MKNKKLWLILLTGALLENNSPVRAMHLDESNAAIIALGSLASAAMYTYGYNDNDIPKPDYLTPSQEEVILQDRLQNLARTYHNFDNVRFLPIATNENFIFYEKASKTILLPKSFYARLVSHIRSNPLFLSNADTANMSTLSKARHSSLEDALRMERKEDITAITIDSVGSIPKVIVTKKTEHPMYADQAYLHRDLASLRCYYSIPRIFFSSGYLLQILMQLHNRSSTVAGAARDIILGWSCSFTSALLSSKYLEKYSYDAIPNDKRLLHAALQNNREWHVHNVRESIIPEEYWEQYPSFCSKLASFYSRENSQDNYALIQYFKKRLSQL